MKKNVLFVALALASAATVGVAQQDNNRDEGPKPERRGGFLAQARTDDGKIDLSKLPERTPQARKDELKAADKDGDGFLSGDELRAVAPRRDWNRGSNGPGFGPGVGNRGPNGPGFGGPNDPKMGPGAGFGGPNGPGFGFGPGFGGPNGSKFGFGAAFKDGKIELAKLPEQTPQERKDALKAADKDGDGFLSGDELRAVAPPKFQFPEGKRPDFVAEDGRIDVAKLTETIKALDKNGDGFIDQDEKKAAFAAAREKFGPGFFANFVRPQAPFGFGPQFGPGADFGGPNGPQGWNGDRPRGDRPGQMRDGDRPRGDRPGQMRDGDRPRGDRPGQMRDGDAPKDGDK